MRSGGLELGELREVGDGGLGLLGFEEGAAEAFEGFDAGGAHAERGAVLLLGGGQVVLVEGDRAFAHGVPEARGGQRVVEAGILRAVLLGLHEEADGAAEVGLLHADVAHAGEGVGVVGSIERGWL